MAKQSAARESRKIARDRENAALCLQRSTRGWLTRTRVSREIKAELDKKLENTDNLVSVDLFKTVRNYLTFCIPSSEDPNINKTNKQQEDNVKRLEKLARTLVLSLDHDSPKKSYVGVALNKDYALAWIDHMKSLLSLFSRQLRDVKMDSSAGQRQLSAWLGVLVAFTATTTWKVFKKESMSKLAPGMEKLCQTFLAAMVTSGKLMDGLSHILLSGLASTAGGTCILKKTALTAAMTLATRPAPTDQQIGTFILKVLSVPGLVHHCAADLAKALFLTPAKSNLFQKCIDYLVSEHNLKTTFNRLEASYALCLTANLVDLVSLIEIVPDSNNLASSSSKKKSDRSLDDDVSFLNIVSVLKGLFDFCGQYVTAKQSNLSHWHPVLGWFSVSIDIHLQNSIITVRHQLAKLWSPSCLTFFTKSLLETVAALPPMLPPPPPAPTLTSPDASGMPASVMASTASTSVDASMSDMSLSNPTGSAKQFFKKAIEKTKHQIQTASGTGGDSAISPQIKQSPVLIKLGNPKVTTICVVCSMYTSALNTLTQIKLEILSGLCRGDLLLPNLWTLMQSLGPYCGLKAFLDHLGANPKATAPEFQLLILFSDCMAHLLTILDDVELYEKQIPFALGHFVSLSAVINWFLFKAIWMNLILDTKSPLFSSMHGLLMVLYRRDTRRPFTRPNHWLVREVKSKELIAEMDKGRRAAALLIQKMPHVIPHSDRIVLFRRKISADKSALGLVHEDVASARSTLVTIHRSRIVEDGYRQLSTLNAGDLKGIIRVKFVNMQGLDEAGIDQVK